LVQLCGIAIVSAVLLGTGIESAGIASPFADPLGRIRAQDESSYAAGAVQLAVAGDWLTPKVLGRYVLFKPPLLVWLSGLCLRCFGISLWALRLPALAAAVCATLAVFWWTLRERSAVVAWSAAVLLLSNPFWHVFARLCYTDMLLAASITGALAFLYWDPAMRSRRSFWGFSACTAAAVMAKSLAGVIPVVTLLLYWLLAPRNRRPALTRIVLAAAAAAALIAPWHLYQIVVHPKWFWADYVQVQLGQGITPPGQISAEGHLWFYAHRIAVIDPVLLLLTVLALPSLVMAVRSRDGAAAPLLAAWLTVSAGALFAFRFHNLPYALTMLPPCALIAAVYGPLFSPRRARVGLPILCLALLVKAALPGQVWGLSFGRAEPLPAAAALRSYANLGRGNDLILVEADDDFCATALPLAKVRYYFFDPDQIALRVVPHYGYLGITVTLDQFERLDQLRPMYAARLKDWGLDSIEPLGTSIVSTSQDGFLRLLRACPRADFYLPARNLPAVEPIIQATHRKALLANGRVLLLALRPPERVPAARMWAPPANW
jgi:4-amino-4-deoxy-L-arabinose transferase-like glycosyltransferase